MDNGCFAMDMNAAAIFVKVVEANGFSAAGRLLAMPKTTVSKKIGELEAELGVRLLNRTTRRLSLTEAGARVHAHCVEAMRNIAAAERAARITQSLPEGLLTIAAPGAIGVPFLLPLITGFMASYPAVEIAHVAIDEPVDLGEQRVDIMIWPGLPASPAHSVQLVARVDIALYASAGYLARAGTPRSPEELAEHAAVAFTQSMIGKRFRWVLHRSGSSVEIEPATPVRFRSNDAGAVLAAVQAGHGIGGLPVRFVDQMAAGRDIVPVLPQWRVPPIELSAFYRDGSASSLKARLFIAFIADWFRRN